MIRIGLRPGVSAVARLDDRVEVQGPLGGVALAGTTPGVRAALRLLGEQGSDERALENAVRLVDGDGALPVLHFCLGRLDALGALSRTLVVDERPLATVEPVAASP